MFPGQLIKFRSTIDVRNVINKQYMKKNYVIIEISRKFNNKLRKIKQQ